MQKTVISLCFLVLLSIFLTSCSAGVQLSDRAIVKAIYINTTNEGKISASLVIYTCKPSANTADVQGEPVIYTGEGDSISAALKSAEEKQNKSAFYEHNRILLFGTGAFDAMTEHLKYFSSEQVSGGDLSVFLTRATVKEFEDLKTSATNLVSFAEGADSKTSPRGDITIKLHELNFTDDDDFYGYLPVVKISGGEVLNADEIILYNNGVPLYSLHEFSVTVMMLISKKLDFLDIDIELNGVLSSVTTQKINIAYEVTQSGAINIILTGNVKSIMQDGQILQDISEENAIFELNKAIEEMGNILMNLTTNNENDILNLSFYSNNKLGVNCNKAVVISNLRASAQW